MTPWTWYAAGLSTTLVLLASLICVYALIVSNTSQPRETREMKDDTTTIRTHNADTADYKRNT